MRDDSSQELQKLDSVPPGKLTENKNPDDPFGHLAPDEAAILKRQVDTPNIKVGLTTLYRYSTRTDLVLLAIGSVCAIASGAILPCMTIVFGSLQGTFAGFFNGTASYDSFMAEMTHLVLYFVYLGVGMFFATYISTVIFIYTGEHISGKIREHYLESCLKQNIGFFDNLGSGEVVTRITADTNLIQDGISEKVAITLTAIATFFAAFIIGFIEYWKLTLILLSTVVAIVFIMGSGSQFIVKNSRANINAYALGGTVAEETLSSVRNAVAFGTQDRLATSYDSHLIKAEYFGVRLKGSLAVMVAFLMMVMNWNYGLAFWQGSVFLVDGSTSLSKVLTVAMAVMIGSFALGNVTPNVQAFTTALGASAKIFTTIDRVSALDSSSAAGDKLDVVEGEIELRSVKMIYPSRPEVTVMDDISLKIPAGKTTALVGASGSGKSTIVGLVERFYEPVQGTVYLDGRDISTLNLRWLRQQISLVSQEPTLFSTTIYDNIRHGLVGTQHENAGPEKQKELIEAAAVKAFAHDFITALPEGYETNVGERGFLLSGGQKQRIAIARAICSDPKILLLDEATSALDSRSEGVVQAALEQASEGRTTIAIAHRLSTIKDADNIVVMSQGKIVEQGTHNELLKMEGAYHSLVTAQAIATVNDDDDESNPSEDDDEIELIKKKTSQGETATAVEGEGGFEADPDDTNIAARLNRQATSKSVSSVAMQNRKAPEEREYSLWSLIKLLASFNKEEWPMMVVGLFFAVLSGGGNPVMSLIFSEIIVALSVPVSPETIPGIKSSAHFWCLMYLMLGLAMLIVFAVQGVIFAFGSERMIHRVRDRAFRAMLRQDVEFFDRDENAAGALTSFLSTEATHMAGLSGATLATILMSLSTLVACCVISLAIGWKLALVCIATIPVLLACGFLRVWMLAQFQRRSRKAYDKSASFASEAITAIRTVASLTREDDVMHLYRDSLATQLQASTKSILRSSTLYAASQSLLFLVFALGFWYGGTLLAKGEYSLFQFFVVFSEIIFGAQSAGTIFSFAPDMGKAKSAATELKRLFDRQPSIDTWSTEGERLSREDKYAIQGTIEFRDVHFRYPTRPDVPVLRGLDLQVRPGQYIALVGPSGCGKSTTIALLERFYNPLAGGVYVDGREISSLNVNDYRSFIALVSQEPTLYAGTIRENIMLGATDPEAITDEQVEAVCREANIYDFILSLPEGFNTVVGSKGTLLSGGQKQRIAIARALIRDPKILLLDEATSALDSESEHVVQAALDKAAKGRTTIAVAHRLSTIAKADCIYVFERGVIVEKGTHRELMGLSGRYAELVRLQSLEKKA
ncbi:P-loop containing nucleoside triphosphate hydrolase protein [Cryphonectria parasitica EP155]|uniref:P-loop containing nucleoside triphosphate hydrolase protein n=1 Tax=Cryphonectria parasitica (strain ATCC 38755 / EP155) TaxID=660469 RepID=A0A9P4YBZ7_CRYP1|nr:P-loop containing nucleoside triphosphate hydrolase protein [Cryphonectria parasitica EP155]KAF3769875.1 P-loop containing nucleoside triphosphate hydrolase protein [Cryphonectria parasitica EP155]